MPLSLGDRFGPYEIILLIGTEAWASTSPTRRPLCGVETGMLTTGAHDEVTRLIPRDCLFLTPSRLRFQLTVCSRLVALAYGRRNSERITLYPEVEAEGRGGPKIIVAGETGAALRGGNHAEGWSDGLIETINGAHAHPLCARQLDYIRSVEPDVLNASARCAEPSLTGAQPLLFTLKPCKSPRP